MALSSKHAVGAVPSARPGSPPSTELRVATIGNVDAGKSTLIGVLSRGVLDDGRGAARSLVFAHAHERHSGRTSDVGRDIIGFNAHGEQVAVVPFGSDADAVGGATVAGPPAAAGARRSFPGRGRGLGQEARKRPTPPSGMSLTAPCLPKVNGTDGTLA